MRAMTRTYYSWIGADGNHNGLVRVETPTGGGPEYAFVYEPAHGWVRKQELLGILIDGDPTFVQITEAEAAGLAHRYGVSLTAPAEWIWRDGQVVSLADGTPAPAREVA